MDCRPFTRDTVKHGAKPDLDRSFLRLWIGFARCLCHDSENRATIDGDTYHFHCVLDALVVPFVIEADKPVLIRSESPVSGTVIEIRAGRDTLIVEPTDAVMSFGAAIDFDTPDTDEFDLSLAHERFCPYANAFPTEAEYEKWAAQTDAVTTAFPIEVGYQLARHVPDSDLPMST
ncbi:alkylmercury lyase family protein [Halomicroarcula sp. F13]|uniref:Alkylmercury lyase family protein n=1 Tax=Haloarcula rubra TaxID=2487747 RepID=A0AAW4PRR9_9EURY|nr:organomercurial lyase [Halomicroarcula rubra]MBX0324278.1 alkylmercury lyase family protein [Halomicroarcula rubra]